MLGTILDEIKMSISARYVSARVEQHLLFMAFLNENVCSHMYVNKHTYVNKSTMKLEKLWGMSRVLCT